MTNIADEAKSARTLDVTMVVGCYNHHSYIEQALDSVLAQSRRPAQLIITDDASSDGSQAVISRWLSVNWPDAIFIKRNKNIGFPAILNEAMSLVSGDLVAVMSADDWMREDRIQLQAEAFESAEPNIGMVWSEAIKVEPNGSVVALKDHGYHPIPARKEGDLFLQLLGPTFISTTSVMMRASALERVGPYDEALVAEDYDMFLRLSRVYLWKYLPYPLVYYRALTTSLSDSSKFHARRRTDRIRILRKHIGTSPESDRIIIEKVSHWAIQLYAGGRSPRDTARDMWLCTKHQPTVKGCLVLILSAIGVQGSSLVAAKGTLRRSIRRRR